MADDHTASSTGKPNREEKPRLFDHGYYGDAAVIANGSFSM